MAWWLAALLQNEVDRVVSAFGRPFYWSAKSSLCTALIRLIGMLDLYHVRYHKLSKKVRNHVVTSGLMFPLFL